MLALGRQHWARRLLEGAVTDTRKKGINWTIKTDRDGLTSIDDAHLAVLMDLRDELQQLNRLLSCTNFTGIPTTLRTIARNTTKQKRAHP